MGRREVVGGLALALTIGRVEAQQARRTPTVALVGIAPTPLRDISGPDPVRPWARAFAQGLHDLGWIDGRTVVVDRRIADPTGAPALLAGLAERGVDVIVVGGARWL